jgi:hypothetical protein
MKDNFTFENLYLNEEIADVVESIGKNYDIGELEIENIKIVDAYFTELKKMLSGMMVKRIIKDDALLQQVNTRINGEFYNPNLIELQLVDIIPINMELNRLLLGKYTYNEFFTYVETERTNHEEMSTTISNTIMTVTDAKYYEEQ